ncbi:MAG: hypothetical protein ABEH90_00755 [Halolamina sp.]
MSRGGSAPRWVALAWARATAVVVGQIAVLLVFLWSVAHTGNGALPEYLAWLPLLAFTGLLLMAARRHYRRSEGENPAWAGYVLVAAAPFTAFGGECAVETTFPTGARLVRSGVRLGVELGGGDCHTYLNGALLVLGYAMLGIGLLVSDGGVGRLGGRLVN